jgi:hypothetical protein
MTRHVAVPDVAVDRFGHDSSIKSNDGAERIFAFAHGDARELDTARHHRPIRRFS